MTPRTFLRSGEIAALAAGFLISSAPLLGQATGRVVGRVVDAANGEPLVAAQVMVEGTDLGNFAREDGSFFIDGVPAGFRTFSTEYLGYGTASVERRVAPGTTTRVDFELSGAALDSPEIVAVIEQPHWAGPDSLVSVVSVTPQPRDLPSFGRSACDVAVTTNGAFILDGRWQLQRSIGRLECDRSALASRPIAPRLERGGGR